MRTIGQIILGTLIGGLVGVGAMWGYLAYNDYRKEQMLLIQQEAEQKQAHQDSLRQVRARQEQLLQEEEKTETERKVMCEYLTSFYMEEIIGDSRASIKPFLASDCQATRADFLPCGENVTKDDCRSMQRRLRIAHDHDDWYRVHLVTNGATSYKYVQARRKGGEIIIFGVR